MTRSIYTKWIVGAVILLLIFACGCFWWYHYAIRQHEEVMKLFDRVSEKNQELLKSKKAKSTIPEETESTQTHAENTTSTADIPKLSNIAEAGNDTETDMPANIEPKTSEDTRVSPNGFGPYPEIPHGAPIAKFDETDDVTTELMLRVAVKAWNEGDRFVSGFYDSARNKVYLNYPNVAYIEYSDRIDEETGEIIGKRITSVYTSSENKDVGELIFEGNIPPGFILVDIDESAGIDPYEYLDLP